MSPPPPATVSTISAFLLLISLLPSSLCLRPWSPASSKATRGDHLYGSSKRDEGSSPFIQFKYHNGPILTSNITVNLVWYGLWEPSEKRIIRDFISSISNPDVPPPSVYQWWSNVRLYTDSSHRNVTGSVRLGGEKNDRRYSRGKYLSRAAIELVIKDAMAARTKPLAFSPGSIYVVLTSADVEVERFCSTSCGHHQVTNKTVVGVEVPYAWVGNSATKCPGQCSFPYAVPAYAKDAKPLKPPNGNGPVEGMVIVLGHELAEMATDAYTTGWYHGLKMDPQEIGDLCEWIYGTGAGGSFAGQMLTGEGNVTYNVNGGKRRFTLPWLWSRYTKRCWGPNAMDE